MKCADELVMVLNVMKGMKCWRLVIGCDLNFQLGANVAGVTGGNIHKDHSSAAHVQSRKDVCFSDVFGFWSGGC